MLPNRFFFQIVILSFQRNGLAVDVCPTNCCPSDHGYSSTTVNRLDFYNSSIFFWLIRYFGLSYSNIIRQWYGSCVIGISAPGWSLDKIQKETDHHDLRKVTSCYLYEISVFFHGQSVTVIHGLDHDYPDSVHRWIFERGPTFRSDHPYGDWYLIQFGFHDARRWVSCFSSSPRELDLYCCCMVRKVVCYLWTHKTARFARTYTMIDLKNMKIPIWFSYKVPFIRNFFPSSFIIKRRPLPLFDWTFEGFCQHFRKRPAASTIHIRISVH